MDDDKICLRCRTSSYQNPSLVLLINTCAHPICSNCVESLFVRPSGPCPVCKTILKKKDFRGQLLENASIDKEVNIRKRILRDFNKKEEDFQTLRDYNDYLEMVETIIFNLSNKIDLEETQRKVEAYRKENLELSIRNRSRKNHDEQEIEMILELERQHRDGFSTYDKEEEERKRKLQKEEEAMIDELMYSHGGADEIVTIHKERAQKAQTPAVATAYQPAGFTTSEMDTEPVRGVLFEYEPLILPRDGLPLLTQDQLRLAGYLDGRCVRETSTQENTAGFTSSLIVEHALSDFFESLFYRQT